MLAKVLVIPYVSYVSKVFAEVKSAALFYCAVLNLSHLNIPIGQVDVHWTSIERPYRTCGRPKGTFNGHLVDVPNETQLARPNRTKMDVHFRLSRDAMHGTWKPSGSPPDVHQMSSGCRLDVIFDWYGAWTPFQTSIRRHIRRTLLNILSQVSVISDQNFENIDGQS